MPSYYLPEVLASIIRYLIKAAQDKRVVPYYELENIFGLSHNMAGFYAGRVGDFCLAQDMPLLNALVVNTTDCMPSHGFASYQESRNADWVTCLVQCWKEYHLPSPRELQVRNFSGLTAKVRDWSNAGMANDN